MANTLNKLSELAVRKATPREKPYKLADGGGLYLQVMPSGAKYWRMKYRYMEREDRLALGVYPQVTLANARKEAAKAKEQLRAGIDPKQAEKQNRLLKALSSESSFDKVAWEWFAKEAPHWSETHLARVKQILEQKLLPYLGPRPVGEISAPELLGALRHTEARGVLETARRALQISGQIFRYAIATGRATRDPSQDLKGALAKPKSRHFAAITVPDTFGELLAAIDNYQGTPEVKAALQLSPLLFCRPGELRQLEWKEVNWKEQRIEIPAEKMKMRQPHIIPLCRQAVSILESLKPVSGHGRYIFPSARGASRPLSENGVRTALRTLGYTNEQMTPHGFRATARTLLDEVLGVRVDLIEHQLAHAVSDANGRAYTL
jgi:integrase